MARSWPITYSSRTLLDLVRLRQLVARALRFSSSSSRMMSLQSSTHSSQMNTDGPAISLRTSCWLLPQNEQYSSLPSSCLPRVSSTMPVASLVRRDAGRQLLIACRVPARQNPYSTSSTCHRYLERSLRRSLAEVRQLAALLEHVVDEAVVTRLLAAHEVVAVGVLLDLVERLAACAAPGSRSGARAPPGSRARGSRCPTPGPGSRRAAGGS